MGFSFFFFFFGVSGFRVWNADAAFSPKVVVSSGGEVSDGVTLQLHEFFLSLAVSEVYCIFRKPLNPEPFTKPLNP